MIRNPNDIQDGAKKIRMLIAGYPGIGKSTLALSAPRPLHIDCDFGIDRIEPRYRMPYIQPRSYDEILNDLKPENLNDFETLVFDTAGKLISLMGLWAIKQNPKYGQRDGSLSLKGYGFVGREFVRLMDYCFYELKKNIVVVFHATEEKDGDNTRLRIKVEGQTKNNVWEPMDLGGFVEMYGNDRTIGFSNCEKYFAKGTRGIRNVLSDGFSWVVVYGLLAVVVIAALVYTHGAFVNIDPGLTAAGIQTGLYKGFLLLPGPFTYPYYYSLFSYNDKNEDGTQHGNMKKSFVLAGVMFGVYMVLAALLTWVNFSPLLNTLKAILITIIALSSLSTYLYSEYLVFGENIGFLIDVLTVTSWQLVIPLGVMGIWTLMSELRVYIIIFVLLASVVLHLVSDRKEDAR